MLIALPGGNTMNTTTRNVQTLVATAAFIIISGCGGGNNSKATADDETPQSSASPQDATTTKSTVSVVRLSPVPWSRQLEVTGKALPKQQSTLSLGVSGMVKKIAVKRGDRVKKGDVLLKLDRVAYQLRIAQAEAALAGASAQQELMKTETVRLDQLLREGAAPSASKDELTAQYRSVDAQASAARSALKLAKNAFKNSVLRAPFDGVVSDILVELGEQAQSTPPTKLMTIVDADTLEVQVFLPEDASSQVRTGDTAAITIDSADVQTEGEIVFVSDVITQGARTFEVRIKVDNKDHLIKGGAFARVHLKRKVEKKTLFAPVDSIQRDRNNKPYVFVAVNKTAQQRFVQLGVVEGARVQIIKGVNAGEQLVISALGTLSDGQKISVKKS